MNNFNKILETVDNHLIAQYYIEYENEVIPVTYNTYNIVKKYTDKGYELLNKNNLKKRGYMFTSNAIFLRKIGN